MHISLLVVVQIVIFVMGIVMVVFGYRVASEENGSMVVIGAAVGGLGFVTILGTAMYFVFGTLPLLLSP